MQSELQLVIDKSYHEKITLDSTLTFCLSKPVNKGVKTRRGSPIDNRPSTYKNQEVKPPPPPPKLECFSGSISGGCASGFGVCCVFEVTLCLHGTLPYIKFHFATTTKLFAVNFLNKLRHTLTLRKIVTCKTSD